MGTTPEPREPLTVGRTAAGSPQCALFLDTGRVRVPVGHPNGGKAGDRARAAPLEPGGSGKRDGLDG